jgi:hypothetical protein
MKPVLLAISLCLAVVSTARADMEISPLRHVITEDSPEGVFVVSNPSDHILDGSVSWTDLTATETGYAPATPEARQAMSAAPYLVVTPAHFRLEPGARIKVSVHLKKGVRIPRGERRSHLLIETAATRTPLRKASTGLQVDIGLGVSAPVILRNGGTAEPTLGETRLLRDKDGALILETSVIPGGDNSAYGSIVIDFAPKATPGEKKTLSIRSNVTAYLDAQSRRIEAPLGLTTLGHGELTVRYEGDAEYEGRIFDRRSFTIEPPE